MWKKSTHWKLGSSLNWSSNLRTLSKVLSKFYSMQNTFFILYACHETPWDPTYCFLRTWNRDSPEMLVFKESIFSLCWVLTKSGGSCLFRGARSLPLFSVMYFSWVMPLLHEMHAGLGLCLGGRWDHLPFISHVPPPDPPSSACVHTKREDVFPIEKELNNRRHSFLSRSNFGYLALDEAAAYWSQ